jgi:hypothetical protein
MNQLFYLPEPISIMGSNLIIIALAKDGSPYGIRRGDFIGDEFTDLDGAFALISFFTRMAERGDDVPDLDDVANSTAAAILYGESLYGKGFFSG